MRNAFKTTAALGALALLATLAQAQFPGGPVRANPTMLLANPGVQKELQLTDEQIDKAKKIAQDLREKYQDDFVKIREAKPEERQTKFQELMAKISAEGQKALATVLKPEQLKRLRQIQLQQTGLNDPEAQKDLRLSDEQKKKIQAIGEESGKEIREAIRGAQGNFQEAMGKIEKVRKAAREKEENVLTDEQKKAWTAMLGKPFELKFERRKKD